MEEQIKKDTVPLFNSIARWYDLLNRLLSLSVDVYWRRYGVKRLLDFGGKRFLDIATGTADVAIEIARQKSSSFVVGIDPAERMLEIGKKKIRKKNLDKNIKFVLADGRFLPFKDKSFDGATVAFGIRNIPEMETAIRETARSLKENGIFMILEFSKPRGMLGAIYNFYFKKLLPFIGGVISKNKKAYEYLPSSVERFPSPKEFAFLLLKNGFKRVWIKPLTFGICICYIAEKGD